MKLEPVAWRVEHDETIFTSYQRGAAEGYALTNGGLPITPLYAIPEGYVVVRVEDVIVEQSETNEVIEWHIGSYGELESS